MVVGWALPLAVAVVPCMAVANARAKRSATAGSVAASGLWGYSLVVAFLESAHVQFRQFHFGDRGHLSYHKTWGTLVGYQQIPETAPER